MNLLPNHEAHTLNCAACVRGFPRACRCGGLVHYGVAAPSSGLFLARECDACGPGAVLAGEEPAPVRIVGKWSIVRVVPKQVTPLPPIEEKP